MCSSSTTIDFSILAYDQLKQQESHTYPWGGVGRNAQRFDDCLFSETGKRSAQKLSKA
jgi:hypothetical protein